MESTSETADTADSETEVTMMVSAMPMQMANSCSMTSGTISRTSASREKSMAEEE